MSFCTVFEPEEFQILKELVNLLRGYSLREQQRIMAKTRKLATQRWVEAQEKLNQLRRKLRQREEELFSEALEKSIDGKSSQEIAQMIVGDGQRQELKEEITLLELEPKEASYEDTQNLLEEYERKGYIEVRKERFQITSRGARLLGRGFLRKIMQNLTKKGFGTHRIEEIGFGPALSRFTRAYEFGDTYDRINIERTFLNVLERGGKINELKSEDLEVYEALHQTKLNVGIIIDESGSMERSYYHGRRKIDAAVETALALAELMRTSCPQDKLRIFTFSEQVRELQPWDILNVQPPMLYTDIRAGLRAYRIASLREDGDKQVYLITDTEPNFEDGRYVGPQRAARGVLEEALRCRKENITINIIMLDQSYHLRELASMVARLNVGRVVFTSPEDLGEAILEDYLTSRRERLLG